MTFYIFYIRVIKPKQYEISYATIRYDKIRYYPIKSDFVEGVAKRQGGKSLVRICITLYYTCIHYACRERSAEIEDRIAHR